MAKVEAEKKLSEKKEEKISIQKEIATINKEIIEAYY